MSKSVINDISVKARLVEVDFLKGVALILIIKQFISYLEMTFGLYAIHLFFIVNPVSEYVSTLNIQFVPTILLSFITTFIVLLLIE